MKYFRFCENVKYASRMKYSATPNVKYFHFLWKMKMCGLEIKYRNSRDVFLTLLEPCMSANRTLYFSFIFVA